MSVPRVAFFTDCFHEVNGVALTSRQLHAFAERRGHPFFSVHTGPQRRQWTQGSVTTLELDRSRFQMALDADMAFDFAFLRHLRSVREELAAFQPDVIHITGPGDWGIMGLTLSRMLKVPLVASWHTDLHKYAGRRLVKMLPFLPSRAKESLDRNAERGALAATLRFYREAAVTLAPNPDLTQMLEQDSGRPCILMRRGIDTELFRPSRRSRQDNTLVLGYVGRLSPEKGIRLLVPLENALRTAGITNYKFVIVGQGSEREYLSQHLSRVEFTGVLKGEALAAAYANMDLFLFPSRTDTFGNVIQEALASGTPAVVFAEGGPKFLIEDGETGLLANSDSEFVSAALSLVQHRQKLSQMAHGLRTQTLDRSWDSVFEEVWRAYRLAASGLGHLQMQSGRKNAPEPA